MRYWAAITVSHEPEVEAPELIEAEVWIFGHESHLRDPCAKCASKNDKGPYDQPQHNFRFVLTGAVPAAAERRDGRAAPYKSENHVTQHKTSQRNGGYLDEKGAGHPHHYRPQVFLDDIGVCS